MTQSYAEIKLQKKPAGWLLSDADDAFWAMTGLFPEDISARFQGQLIRMLAAADVPAADKLFSAVGAHDLSPWVFTLTCAAGTVPVLFQIAAAGDADGLLQLRVFDASFVGTQITRMGRRVQSLENSIPSGLCQVLCDESFTIIRHNQNFLDLIGYTEEQFLAELDCKGSGYVHPDDHEMVAELFRKASQGESRTFTTEMRIIRRDRKVLTLLTSLSLTNETVHGFPVLYSVGIDITAQKRARQVELDADRLRLAMDQTSNYILEYDLEQNCLLASEGLYKFLGISGNLAHVSESLVERGLLTADNASRIAELFHQIKEGAPHADGVVALHRLPGVETEQWFRLRLTPVPNRNGQPAKVILLVEDITEHYKIELRYHEEEERRVAMTYDMNFSFQINLTKEQIISANKPKFPFFDFNDSSSVKELLRRNAAYHIHPDDRSVYLNQLSPEHLLDLFGQGVPEMTFDFRREVQPGGYHWYRGVAHIIREPTRGDVCAYVYTKDIEAEKKQELELRRHAEQDSLTGLYNRYTVELYCDRLLEQQPADQLSVLFMLDLDQFKFLNDTYGHLRGDDMLRQAGASLREIFGADALLGRLGGDEFVAYQPQCEPREAQQKIEQVCRRLRSLEAGAGVVTVSAGLAFAPRDGHTFAELYRCADSALYRAKRSGKNQWAVYDPAARDQSHANSCLPVSREWLLEESSDVIYVSDFYSYDLLYMNLGARTTFGVEDNRYLGRKCYEVLQQKDHPCDFCTNHLLCREQFHCWEYRNPTVGRAFLLRDRIVDWYGIPARIEFATDVSAIDHRTQVLEEQVKFDRTIIDCLQAINSAPSLDQSAECMLARLAEFYGADRAFILEYNPAKNRILPHYEWSRPGKRTIRDVLGKKGVIPSAAILTCLQRREPYWYDQNRHAIADPDHQQSLHDADVRFQRCVPLQMNGQPAGFIGLDNPTVFRDELSVLETLGYFISEELSKNKLSESLSFLSYHDSLTGLWNRNRYVEYLSELDHRPVWSLGVAVADLNALKDINKLRGHLQGDRVVKRAADLLRESFPNAQVFRLSGDEFVILSENSSRQAFLEEVQRVCDRSDDLKGNGIAVGYAWTDQEIDCQKLTMQATDIMIMRKQEYYQHERGGHLTGKHDHARLQELMHCLQNNHFQIYLQPKADCSGFRLNGAEALVRYCSPETGVVPPVRFIPTLEREHLIQYIDLFVFEEVCKLLSRWQKERRPLLTISLNFSRQTVLEPDLLKTLCTLADRYQIPKDCIEIEITESLGDYESATVGEIGSAIKSAGFRLALDDFGSHYTNMAMLSAVPADVLKLDRGLVRDVLASQSNQLVLKSILSLCKDLGVSSIAEGVETQEQLDLLRSLQCDSIQGFLFGRPAPVPEFEERFLL